MIVEGVVFVFVNDDGIIVSVVFSSNVNNFIVDVSSFVVSTGKDTINISSVVNSGVVIIDEDEVLVSSNVVGVFTVVADVSASVVSPDEVACDSSCVVPSGFIYSVTVVETLVFIVASMIIDNVEEVANTVIVLSDCCITAVVTIGVIIFVVGVDVVVLNPNLVVVCNVVVVVVVSIVFILVVVEPSPLLLQVILPLWAEKATVNFLSHSFDI
jgi:hypothetical protein